MVEHHGDLFARWRQAIDTKQLEPPLHVTHVDAHADLGVGDHGYVYLMTSLLLEDPADRRTPKTGDGGLGDGNWLLFAIACQWISDLVYVFNEGGGDDLLTLAMENFVASSDHIQLAAMSKEGIDQLLRLEKPSSVAHLEPRVPFSRVPWRQFQAGYGPFDVICLARSPAYTPVEADVIFDMIRERFIDETPFSSESMDVG